MQSTHAENMNFCNEVLEIEKTTIFGYFHKFLFCHKKLYSIITQTECLQTIVIYIYHKLAVYGSMQGPEQEISDLNSTNSHMQSVKNWLSRLVQSPQVRPSSMSFCFPLGVQGLAEAQAQKDEQQPCSISNFIQKTKG